MKRFWRDVRNVSMGIFGICGWIVITITIILAYPSSKVLIDFNVCGEFYLELVLIPLVTILLVIFVIWEIREQIQEGKE